MLVRKLKALILGAEIRCIRSRNTFPGFLSHLVFTPRFRIGQRITGVFSVVFLVSCYANFFTYVTAPALKFFDYGYLYNTFPVNRYISIYIFQVIVNKIRTCTLMFMHCQYVCPKHRRNGKIHNGTSTSPRSSLWTINHQMCFC